MIIPSPLNTALEKATTSSSPIKRRVPWRQQSAAHRALPGSTTPTVHGKSVVSSGTTDLRLIRAALSNDPDNSETAPLIPFQINGATLEEVFLDLNRNSGDGGSSSGLATPEQNSQLSSTSLPAAADLDEANEKDLEMAPAPSRGGKAFALTAGHKPSYLLSIPLDAWVIFRKRLIILRRTWLLPLIGILIAVAATCIPLFFIKDPSSDLRTHCRRKPTTNTDLSSKLFPCYLLASTSFPIKLARRGLRVAICAGRAGPGQPDFRRHLERQHH